MKIEDTPAFPSAIPDIYGTPIPYHGLTIRQEFAKAAMQGILANDCAGGFTYDQIAVQARMHADALISELEKTK